MTFGLNCVFWSSQSYELNNTLHNASKERVYQRSQTTVDFITINQGKKNVKFVN